MNTSTAPASHGPDRDIIAIRRALIIGGAAALIFHLTGITLNSIEDFWRWQGTLADAVEVCSACSLAAAVVYAIVKTERIPIVTPAILVAAALVPLSQVIGMTEGIPALNHVPVFGREGFLYGKHLDDLFLYSGLGAIILASVFSISDAVSARRRLLDESAQKDAALREREQSEEALRESERRYRNLVDHAPVAIAVTLADKLVYANPAALALIGAAREEDILGRSFLEFLHPTQHPIAQERIRVRAEATAEEQLGMRIISREWTLIRLDGREVRVVAAGTPVDYHGSAAVQSVLVDVTERYRAEEEKRRLEEQLLHSQKMEAIGTLAGGVAHDFNNLLTGILGYADLLKTDSPPGSQAHCAAQVIETAATRAAELTRQLLGFARKGKMQNVPVDLHDVVKEVTTLLNRTIEKNIAIKTEFDADYARVLGDPGQVQQVVLNLAINAREAIGAGGGEIRFRTAIHEVRERAAEDDPAPGTYLLLEIADTGAGIPADVIARIFEPFFTTKSAGKGTGMGLAMVYGIVENHGGVIRVSSREGEGASFRVYLPLAPRPAGPESPYCDAARVVQGRGTVLLVDDEEVVRQMATAMLERLGYSVLAAASGEEALACFRDHATEINIGLIDMMMPGMGGGDCYRAIRAIDPNFKAILSTGYGRNGTAQELLEEGMIDFVQKPYRMAQLSEAMAGALR